MANSSNSRRHWGTIIAIVGILVFVAVVTILHLIQPEYDPVYQLMSELALGTYGWSMFLAFSGLACATFGIQLELGHLDVARSFRILLIIASLFFLAAGVFPLGSTSEIHIASIAMAFILTVLAMYLFPTNAGRAAMLAPRRLSWSLAVGLAGSVAISGHVVPIGIGQRLAAACLLAWLMVVSWRLCCFKLSFIHKV